MAVISKKAGGNIGVCRFVMTDTSADNQVIEATAGAKIFGISQAGTRRTPYSTLDDGFAAIVGEDLEVFIIGETNVMLELGGTVTPGDRLKATTGGKGILTTATGDEVGALALVAGTSGQLIPVELLSATQF